MILVGSLRIAEPKSGCQESPETPKEFVILPGRVDGAGPAQGCWEAPFLGWRSDLFGLYITSVAWATS